MDNHIDIDFETYSDIDLKKVGVHRYALHPSTDILCMAYSIDKGEPNIYIPNRTDLPYDLFECIQEGYLVYAWNAAFEICIWDYVSDWPKVPFNQWRDTQAIALNFALPADLKTCGKVLDVEVQKDAKGTRLINRLSKPQKITKKHPYTRYTPVTHPDLFEQLYDYCKQDVLSEQAIHAKLPWELTDQELDIWRATFHKNATGIPVDMEFVKSANEKLDEYLKEANAMLPYLTGGSVTTVNQRDKILQFCLDEGFPLPNLQAPTVEEFLNDNIRFKYPKVKQVLTIRSLAGKASVKKFKKIQMAACEDDRVRDCLKYHRATTGREGGRLLQPQNLPRMELGKDEQIILDAINSFKEDTFEETLGKYERLIDTASALVRPTICATEGKHLKVADYNAVEARGVCWLADQQDVLDLFRQGKCVYSHMASKIYNVPPESIDKESRERFHGKQTILGCGYGMGGKKFRKECAKYGLEISDEEAEDTIRIYRKTNAKVAYMWNALKNTAVKAIENPSLYTSYEKLSFMYLEGFLYMILPNGKLLSYPNAFIVEEETSWGGMAKNIYHDGYDSYTKQWSTLLLTGTRITENATQAICREVLMEAQLDLMRAGYEVVITVHDEIVSHDDLDFGSLDEMYRIMCNRSDYWEGLPLAADGFTSIRYKK